MVVKSRFKYELDSLYIELWIEFYNESYNTSEIKIWHFNSKQVLSRKWYEVWTIKNEVKKN